MRYNKSGGLLEMDLEGLAEDLEGTAARQAVSQWLAALEAEPYGRTVVSHIDGEANLPLYGEGRDAIRRFVHAAAARRSGNPNAREAVRETYVTARQTVP